MKKKEMADLLLNRGIPLHTWGSGDTKTLDDLFEEYKRGEMSLDIELGERFISVVLVHIWADLPHNGGFIRKKLIEMKKRHAVASVPASGNIDAIFGAVRFSPLPGHESSVSEKIRFLRGETALQAAVRGIQEEPNPRHRITGRQINRRDLGKVRFHSKTARIEVGSSDTYPGLMTRKKLIECSTEFPPEFVDPKGYSEKKSGKIVSYFPWVNPQGFRGRVEDVAPLVCA